MATLVVYITARWHLSRNKETLLQQQPADIDSGTFLGSQHKFNLADNFDPFYTLGKRWSQSQTHFPFFFVFFFFLF
jgi:hypothetical protein